MKTRMFYLDALRSVAMLFGLLVHAGTLQSDSILSKSIFFASEQFRMAIFFVISGFFATLVLDRRGWRAFWKHRAMGLVIPLVTALLVLNPVAWWLVYIYNSSANDIPVGLWAFLAGERPYPARPINWHLHLWFLFALIAYVVALPGFRHLLGTRAILGGAKRLASLQTDVMALGVAVLLIGGEITGRGLCFGVRACREWHTSVLAL